MLSIYGKGLAPASSPLLGESYMPYDPERHHRRSIRLKGYDYSQAGAYAVTLVSYGRETLFGEVVDGQMVLNAVGKVIAATWQWLAVRYPHVTLDAWVVMPNHLHGIIILAGDDCRGEEAGDTISPSRRADAPASSPLHHHHPYPSPQPHGTQPGSLNAIIQAYKAESTRRLNRMLGLYGSGNHIWQRDYYERIIRNERETDAIRAYIANNPIQWAVDRENPLSENP